MAQSYNNPHATPSSIGEQFNVDYWDRKSLIEAARKAVFSPLAKARNMPLHYGKELKILHYMPLLDDRNENTQGIDANGVATAHGNLYGSSRDHGTMIEMLPAITENGGRVNRVGWSRRVLRGSISEYGFFTEWTEEFLKFDTDSELYAHQSRELLIGANQIVEDLLQIDLLSAAGTIMYTGTATADNEVTAEGVDPSIPTYDDLRRMSIILDLNRTPRDTVAITGSTLEDTRTINHARYVFIGPELQTTVENMLNQFGQPAFVPRRQYADADNKTAMENEIGSIGEMRFVVNQEMIHWAGEGASVVNNPGYRANGGAYNIYPMLIVGSDSFSTIGLQGSHKKGTKKFRTNIRIPGKSAVTSDDPYNTKGLSSIKFYHGFIAERPERIAIIKCVAPV